MTAKEMFEKEGFKYIDEYSYGVRYRNGYPHNLNTRFIEIDKYMSFEAWENAGYEVYPSFGITPNLTKAIIQQLKEFDKDQMNIDS